MPAYVEGLNVQTKQYSVNKIKVDIDPDVNTNEDIIV